MKNPFNGNGGIGLFEAIVSKLSIPYRPPARKSLPYLLAGSMIAAALPVAAANVVELDGAVSTNGTSSLTSTNTISLTHITGTGDNRLTLVGLSWNANTSARTISGVTFTPDGGTATNLTLVRSQISAATMYRYAAIYALTNPPSGQSGTITATLSGSVTLGTTIGAANFKGVDPTTPLGTSSGAGAASGATVSTSLSGLNGNELVFDTVFLGGAPPPSPTANAGQTWLWNTNIGNTRSVASIKQVAATSYTSSWISGDSTRPWAIVAVPINPLADTTPPTVTINQAAGQADPTSDLPINFTVNFSEPVTDFASGDVTLGGTAGATTAIVTGSGTNYNVAVSGIIHSSTVTVSIAAGVAHDAAGNPNLASTSTDDTVTFVPDSTAISSSANPSGYLAPVNFTASIQTNGVTDATATGTVTFSANGTPFSTNAVVNGSAISDNIASLPRGTNTIVVIYSGDGNFAADTNDFVQIVTNHPPSVANVSYNRDASVNNLAFPISELLAAAGDVDGDTLSFVGVGTSTGGITPVISGGSLLYTNANIVNDQFAFSVSDGFGGTNSALVQIVVTNTLTTFTLTSSAPTNGYLTGVTFTAALWTNGFAATTATSNVVFSANGIPFSTNAIVSGSASASISTLPRGTANITADYPGDGNFAPFTSSLTQTITNHPPVASWASYKRGALTSPLSISVSDLLSHVADADGDAVSLVSVSASAQGIVLSNDGTTLTYDNTNAVNDQFTFTVSDGLGGTSSATASVIGSGRHNILLIIADDLGADSLSLFNSTNNAGVSLPPTPNLEKLGRQGVLFPNFYARPSCSQFRACALTGRHSFRTGVGTAISGSTTPSLRTNEYTLARALTTNAPQYSLASFGKWHLRPTTELDSPLTTGGWTNYAGFFGVGVSSYTSWTKIKNGVSANSTTYSTSDQINEAISFIQSQGTNRWFTWLALNAPHSPRNKPPTSLLKTPAYIALSGISSDISANPRPYWEAMVEAADTEIGRLLTVVDTNDTDIIFVGDNGTERDVQQWPYKNSNVAETTTGNGHAKFTLYEGGERTPFFVTGPSVVNGGRTNNTVVDAVDIFQLVQELAGVDVAATKPADVIIDSQSILPALKGDANVSRPYLFSEQFNLAGDGFTIQNGKFKLLHFYSTHVERLYDIANDPYEYTNLLATALTPVAQSNYNDLQIHAAPYLTLANTNRTRNLVPYPAINGAGYTNGAFTVSAQSTQLSANGAFPNANQPDDTQYSLTGTNLSYQLILWRSAELNNPLAWTPVATNVAAGLTTSFLQLTNGLLVDPNATNDHYFYRVTHYTPYP